MKSVYMSAVLRTRNIPSLADRLTNNAVTSADDSDPGRFVWGNVTSVFFGDDLRYCTRGFSDTHIDQSKVVFIDWELLRADVFLQSRGIGALKDQRHEIRNIFFFYIVSKSFHIYYRSHEDEMKALFVSFSMVVNPNEYECCVESRGSRAAAEGSSKLRREPKLQANYSIIDQIILPAKHWCIRLQNIVVHPATAYCQPPPPPETGSGLNR